MSLANQVKEQFEHLPAGGVIASRTLHKLSPGRVPGSHDRDLPRV